MQIFANRNPRLVSSPSVYIALAPYAGSAGRWGKGDAVIIFDPAYAAWLMREASIVPATLAPAVSPRGGALRPLAADPEPEPALPAEEAWGGTVDADNAIAAPADSSPRTQKSRGRKQVDPVEGGEA